MPCPTCGKPEQKPHAPFCSKLCKERDLLNWLNESYRIPSRAVEYEEEAEE